MRKRASKRRWKRRCQIGRAIPKIAIVEHRLGRWFLFVPEKSNRDVFYVEGTEP